VDIFKQTAKKKIKRADQILPEVYGTTLKRLKLVLTYIFSTRDEGCFFSI
jgi:hypothetical protein